MRIMQASIEHNHFAQNSVSRKFRITEDYTISANIANIRSNLQFVDENKGAIAGTMSVDELAGFTKQLESGNMKSLNVAQITDASYELQSSDIADNTLKILD